MCPGCLAAITVAGVSSVDRAPQGRNKTGHWWRRHDKYNRESSLWTNYRMF
jgi:predicted dithiol-disulfide oxidoreductase (DUF899 family)